MLIDLARNDIGRIAQTGSVKVTDAFVIERYSHVMHIVSNVEGLLKPGMSNLDVLRATFPAGTLTGAPKVRAMQIIDELEPVKRGIYGGACGYLSFAGDMDVAIAIRTGIVKDHTLYVQAAAGSRGRQRARDGVEGDRAQGQGPDPRRGTGRGGLLMPPRSFAAPRGGAGLRLGRPGRRHDMLLMIDNYDSFTYNLVQYFGELGQDVRVVRNDEITVAGIAELQPERIVFSPGPCSPAEAGVCVEAIQHFAGKLPLLGVCLGHQAIGAALRVARWSARRCRCTARPAPISTDQQGVFHGLPAQFSVVRYHSLAIERASLPADLLVTATSEDGEIMGVRHRGLAIEGVQFHPESILSEHGHAMLKNFLERTR